MNSGPVRNDVSKIQGGWHLRNDTQSCSLASLYMDTSMWMWRPTCTCVHRNKCMHVCTHKSVHCVVCHLPVCLLVFFGGRQWHPFIFMPTVPWSSAKRALKLCIIKSLLALKLKQSLSSWNDCGLAALSLTRPAWHLSSIAFCDLFILICTYPWCALHILPREIALSWAISPLATEKHCEVPTPQLHPQPSSAIYLTPAFCDFST